VLAIVLLARAAYDAHTQAAWVGLVLGALAGAVPMLAYTFRLAREGKLFLRDRAAIERNRTRIATVSVPLGWALAAVFLFFSVALGGPAHVALLALVGGAALGLSPGIAANFIRLRREHWWR
jgi:hypothetical protein